MPTYNWIREKAEDHYWDNHPSLGWISTDVEEHHWENRPFTSTMRIRNSAYACDSCDVRFGSFSDLRRHKHLAHPIALPELYFRGIQVHNGLLQRSRLTSADVHLINCSNCQIQIPGTSWKPYPVAKIWELASAPQISTLNIRLTNEDADGNSQTAIEFRIDVLIPRVAELNSIDGLFIDTFADRGWSLHDVLSFHAHLPLNAAARDYGSALGDYALGIHIKERRQETSEATEFAEFARKMRSALHTLQEFDNRRVALAVCNSIRFNLNDFATHRTTAATDLEPAMTFFRRFCRSYDNVYVKEAEMSVPRSGVWHAVCPVDNVTHRLVSVCGPMSQGGKPRIDYLNDLQQLPHGNVPISSQDQVKIHVTCAEGFLRLGRTDDAKPHLQKLRSDYEFRDWAHQALEVL